MNMAVDEALLESFDPAASLPVLRLYGWEPPAFSLGRFQQAEDALCLERCVEAGIPVVRRITGGGVIYHAEELTYSIVCSPRHLSGGQGVKESFRELTGFLLRFYKRLGLAASWAADVCREEGRLGERTPLCFAGREEYDVVIGGRKIGGNAQRRLRERIFQHGSIPLRGALAAALPLFRQVPPGLLEGTVSLRELGVTEERPRLAELLAASFTEALGVSLVRSELTGEEADTASRLRECRYLNDTWNLQGVAP